MVDASGVLWRKRIESLKHMEEVASDLLELSDEAVPRADFVDEDEGGKRRRMVLEPLDGRFVSHFVRYPWKTTVRSRRYAASSPAAQHMDQRIQKLLLEDTVDFDIANCMPVLLWQMVQRLGLQCRGTFESELALLRKVATQRKEYCEQSLGVPEAIGKQVLREMLQGKGAPPFLSGNEEAARLASLARFLR